MGNLAIRVEQLGKRYRIGERRASYKTIREALSSIVMAPLHGLNDTRAAESSFWALDDVSFQIQHGEVMGIIGHNGAGKSTLLKVLSRITKPTRGRVELYGRVGSLLEVGTGFHPELTGRENIYLNGAILGMSRKEIGRKFDEIVSFAEIEKFLDTPVKFYSSGMYVRLAFAVAAHLEPEILMVDEVLAVGDAEFQKKSLGKMEAVAKEGRTVLFVSHNLGAITSLCTKALLLQAGRLVGMGSSVQVAAQYLSLSYSEEGSITFQPDATSQACFSKMSIVDKRGKLTPDISVMEDFVVRLEYSVRKELPNLDIAFILFDRNGSKVLTCSLSKTGNSYFSRHPQGKFVANVKLPAQFLAPGAYTLSPAIHQRNVKVHDIKNHVLQLRIVETGSVEYPFADADIGSVLVAFEWDVEIVQ